MLKIKNKLVNTKEFKNQNRLQKYVEFKKKIRLKTKKIIPLTRQEEMLYNDHNFKNNMSQPKENEFFRTTGDIVLLDIYPKSDLNTFINGIRKLLLNNPSNNPFTNNPIDDEWESRLLHWNDSNSYCSYGLIGYCSPNSKDLKNIIDFIRIDIFNFSNDYFGLSFKLHFSKDLKAEINSELCLNEEFDTDVYKKYSYKHKTYIGKYSYNPEIIRKNILNNKLIEIKCRAHKFILNYIKLSPINSLSPISVDFYYTNIKDIDSAYYRSFDFYLNEDYIFNNLTIIHESSEIGQQFVRHDYMLPLYVSYVDPNRSTPLFILDEEYRYNEIYIYTDDMIDIFIIVLYMHLVNEFNSFISEERDLIEKNYSKFGIKFNYHYNRLSEKILKFNLIFNEVCQEHITLPKERIKTFHEHLNKNKIKIMEKHELFEKACENKISISNYNVSFWLSFISIIIAIIAFIASLFYNSSPSYNNEINDIIQNQKIIFDELKNIENHETRIIETLE